MGSLSRISLLTRVSGTSSLMIQSSLRSRNQNAASVASSVSPYRHLSTAAGGKQQRISLALYRQLLRWCDTTEDNVPLSFYIPPITLQPPQIDEKTLSALAAGTSDDDDDKRVKLSMFPPNTLVDSKKLVSPITNAADVRAFFRSIFRVNATAEESSKVLDLQKQRISLAFEAIKSLNELTLSLADLKKNSQEHTNREGVNFRVGEVVKHKLEDWRGFIVGWERIDGGDLKAEESSSDPSLTSLTKKAYESKPEDHNIKYSIILDSGDAHLHYVKRRTPGDMSLAEAHQPDLSRVEDERLCRIRSSHTPEHFKCFDPATNSFVPNDLKSYEFPMDRTDDEPVPRPPNEMTVKAADAVTSGVKDTANYLKDIIMGGRTSAPELKEMKLLSFFLDRLNELSSGDVIPVQGRLNSESPQTPQKLAILHLQQLHNLVVETGQLIWQRRTSMESPRKTQFNLGDVVLHQKYGFRGVIVAWDPKPSVDVSRWDGLQHIKDPHEYPFYHIIPDQSDCIEVFGGERSSRYVCEANLTLCPIDRRNVDVDLEPEWKFNHADRTYIPPEDLKFKYAGDLNDDGVTENCLIQIKDGISRLLVSARDGTSTGVRDLDTAAEKMSTDNLFKLLKASDSMDDATIVSEILKELWKAHVDSDLRWRLDTAIGHMLSGNTELALSLFAELVEEDPQYAEAWNKASTCEFMMGNMDGALAAAQKTLELIPNHYQALNGLGLIHYENKELSSAVDCFQKSMQIDPWSPVSSRLAACQDTLDARTGGAIKGSDQEWKAP